MVSIQDHYSQGLELYGQGQHKDAVTSYSFNSKTPQYKGRSQLQEPFDQYQVFK